MQRGKKRLQLSSARDLFANYVQLLLLIRDSPRLHHSYLFGFPDSAYFGYKVNSQMLLTSLLLSILHMLKDNSSKILLIISRMIQSLSVSSLLSVGGDTVQLVYWISNCLFLATIRNQDAQTAQF